MRKIAIAVMMLAAASSGFAQKKNVSKAENNLYEPVDLKAAKSAIELAISNPETKDWVKTYYVAGRVYGKIQDQEENNRMLGKAFDKKVANENAIKSAEAYMKAAELDVKPNEKGKIKPKYTKDIKKALKNLSNYLSREGYNAYAEKDYTSAVALLDMYLEIPGSVAMKGEPSDSLYNQLKEVALGAYMNIPGSDAKTIQYMNELKNDGYKVEQMYGWMYEMYAKRKTAKDTLEAVKVLEEGLKKFPKNEYLIGNLINYYIFSGKENDAIAYLDKAIKENPSETQFKVVKAKLFLDNKKDYAKTIAILDEVLASNPNDFSANALIGRAYTTKAEELLKAADKITDNNKYKAEKKKADAEFTKSLPYLEKAQSINGDDLDNLYVMRAVYMRLGLTSKYGSVNSKINELEGR